jgi:DnaJ like chaperone protein
MKDGESPVHVLWLPTILAAGIAYVVSMIDLIPGIGPISLLDDIAVIIGLVWFFTSWLPRNSHRIYWFRPHTQDRTADNKAGASRPSSDNGAADFDPFAALGLAPGAQPEEIKRAYRAMLSKYHPDKVNHLGTEFQQMAHQKVLEIRKAYDILCGKG